MSRTTMKILAVPLACAAIGIGLLASTTEAEARWRGRHYGGAVAAGIIGGLAIGALAASAARPAYGYAVPVYGGPYCYTVRERVFVPGWGWTVRRATVCD